MCVWFGGGGVEVNGVARSAFPVGMFTQSAQWGVRDGLQTGQGSNRAVLVVSNAVTVAKHRTCVPCTMPLMHSLPSGGSGMDGRQDGSTQIQKRTAGRTHAVVIITA
jgi:hypothetical protein